MNRLVGDISPKKVYVSYAMEDEKLQRDLLKHLSNLQRQNIIDTWYSHKVLAGEDRSQTIDEHLSTSSIILLLISKNFLASDYCYSHEMTLALKMHEEGVARVIPILLSPCDWQHSPFVHLQSLPRNDREVTTWRNRDQAFTEIVNDIREVVSQSLGDDKNLPVRKKYRPISVDPARQDMLGRMWNIWIDGFLRQSLYSAALISLGLSEQPDAVNNPWRFSMQEIDQPAHVLAEGTYIIDVYDTANRELLILGEPGSGKTTLLLELVQDLLRRAEHDEVHPIPIIFNLSSWSSKRQRLEEWLTEELKTKYQVPRRLSRAWINDNKLLLLLDGLDEVNPSYYSECIKSINVYREEHGFVSIVVCSRSRQYFEQKERLVLQKAVVIEPLTTPQIDAYLQSGGLQLETIREALNKDSGLQELVTTPLMLSVLTVAYQGNQVEDFQGMDAAEIRKHIFATYVDRVLKRRKTERFYVDQQTKGWLSWLAQQLKLQNQSDFYLEQMQPSWLPQQVFYWFYPITARLVTVLFCGLITSIAFLASFYVSSIFNVVEFGGSVNAITSGLVTGFLIGLLTPVSRNIQPAETIVWSWSDVGKSFLRSGSLRCALVGSLLSILISKPVSGSLASQYVGFYTIIVGLIGATISGYIGGALSRTLSKYRIVPSALNQPYSRRRNIVARIMRRINIGIIAALIASFISFLCALVLLSLLSNITFALGMSAIIALFFGPIIGFSVAFILWIPREIPPEKTSRWLWKHIWNDLFRVRWISNGLAFGLAIILATITLGSTVSLALGLFLGVIFGVFSGMIDELVSGLSSRKLERHIHIRPNQGIWQSGRNSLLIGLIFGLTGGLLFGLIGGLLSIVSLSTSSPWILVLFIGALGGIISGLTAGLLNGGLAYLQHGLLRLLLRFIHATPKNYVKFLNYASERILLHKIGGGYTFVHRQLLDYFVTQTEEQSYPHFAKRRVRAFFLSFISLCMIIVITISGFVGYRVITNHNYPNVSSTLIATNPYPSYLPGHGSLVLYDSLTQASDWANQKMDHDGCLFFQRNFYIYETVASRYFSCYETAQFKNIAFEVQVIIVQGDCGGILLRANPLNNKLYLFDICRDTSYRFIRYANGSSTTARHIVDGHNSIIHTQARQANLIAVVAQGNTFTFFVNNKKIATAKDDTYTEGDIGLFAEDFTHPTEVVYRNVRVWAVD